MTVIKQQAPKALAKPLVVREQFEEWFDAAAEVLRSLDIPVDWSLTEPVADPARSIGAEWSNYRAAYMSVNFELLTYSQHRRLHRQLTHALPTYLDLYCRYAIKHGFKKATLSRYVTLRSKLLRIYAVHSIGHRQRKSALSAHQVQQRERYESALNQAMSRTQSAVKPKSLTVAKVENAAAHFAFLQKIKAFDSELGEAAHALLGDWSAAYVKVVAVEDRYRLEQVVNAHLPEIVRLLPSVTTGSRSEAAKLVGEQLALLHSQVREVLARHEVDALTALRTQSAFLKQLAAKTSSLELDAEATGALDLEHD